MINQFTFNSQFIILIFKINKKVNFLRNEQKKKNKMNKRKMTNEMKEDRSFGMVSTRGENCHSRILVPELGKNE